ncbi:MAG: endonuclease/exonuclease/phosphatase family protein, partial [Bacteroidia bacterium]|nr:endonuclease/exonuclease/phosphatase family protein [Bacteroidia bacterium]
MKKVTISFVILCLLFGSFILVVDKTNLIINHFEPVEQAKFFQAQSIQTVYPAPDSLKCMDWNIKFAGARIDFFFDCFGDREVMTEAEVIQNLNGLVHKINEENPDILLLQEVDIDSDRSARVNMIQYLLDNTNLNYGVFASHWDILYVPKHSIGRINSGNVILSKWKFKEAIRIALPIMEKQDALTRMFYLRRNILIAQPEIPGWDSIVILNIHSDAYSKDGTKRKHADSLHKHMKFWADKGYKVVGGGDLNIVPPGTQKLKNFPDSKCTDPDFEADDYTNETNWIDHLYRDFMECIPLDEYHKNESAYYSHTVDGRGFW